MQKSYQKAGNQMEIGLSTACFYPEMTEVALRRVGELGFHTAEVFFNSTSELTKPFLRELQAIQTHYGIRIVSIHPFTSFAEGYMFFSGYERRVQDSIDFYKRYFEAANQLGASILVLHGGKKPGMIGENEYFARYHRLYQAGQAAGVTVAHENVVHFVGESVRFLQKMANALADDFKMVFDIKQAVRAQQDIFSFPAKLGSHIVHVHLSDHMPGRDCIAPGEGTFDFARLLHGLRQAGYTGNAVIELYSSGFERTEQLVRAREFLLKTAKKIQ